MKKRIISIAIILAVLIGSVTVGILKLPIGAPKAPDEDEGFMSEDFDTSGTVYIWYSDEAITNYLNSAAVEYNESHSTRVMPVLVSPLEYLEAVNTSVVNDNVPDMYIISHDALGKAYRAGLASEITMDDKTFDDSYIGQAKNSVTYKDMLLGYPLNFETSTLIYNKTYLRDMAIKKLDEEAIEKRLEEEKEREETASPSPSPTQTPTPSPTATPTPTPTATADPSASAQASRTPAPTPTDSPSPTPTPVPTPVPYPEDEINKLAAELLPQTIDEMTTLADSYDAPDEMESFLTWDVTDVFYNYFFLGNAINVGGEAGWDSSKLDIYNENAIASLEEYQNLNQFFSIDTSECSYENVIQDFIDGKIVFTIATTDVINTLNSAKEEGLFNYDYGVTLIPDMNDEIDTRTMSVTNCVVVSPFSSNMDTANDFARFLTTDYAEHLYSKSGKVSTAKGIDFEYDGLDVFVNEYGYSCPMPKMIETSSFWVELEAVFSDVWNGEDANNELKTLAENMLYQLSGTKTELEHIEIVKETEDVEYYEEADLIDAEPQ